MKPWLASIFPNKPTVFYTDSIRSGPLNLKNRLSPSQSPSTQAKESTTR